MPYRYVKLVPVTVTVPLFPLLSLSMGAMLLLWVIWPISSQLLFVKTSGYFVTPVAEDMVQGATTKNNNGADLTKASNWFPNRQKGTTVTSVDSYTLSIPKLRIHNARVKIGTDDLSQNLIHYGGTGLPGKYGNTVIFGHSILPQFYDPTNYISIFSLLYQLKENDDIFVRFDGVDYRYKMTTRRVTSPEDVTGLEEQFDNSYITLVTCFPSGTYLQRLWLTAKQVPFGSTTI